jgi:SHOCT-like domain
MSEEKRKILEMLSAGKISVQEAEQLLQAVETPVSSGNGAQPHFFRILVNKPARDGKKAENVNIRVPISVVRGGLRLSALFPGMMGKKKIQLDDGTELDLSKMHYSDLEAMIKDIGELTVDVDGDAQVRIRCE